MVQNRSSRSEQCREQYVLIWQQIFLYLTTYTMEYSAVKNMKILLFATWEPGKARVANVSNQ